MNYSKNVFRLAKSIVNYYGNYNPISNEYIFDISDVPDFDLQELASAFMIDDESLASEATGLDNPSYKKTMLPELINFLQHSNDPDYKYDFLSAWKEGVTNYFRPMMDALFQEILDQRNREESVTRKSSYQDEFRGAL